MGDRTLRRDIEERIVSISEVNTEKSLVVVRDNYNTVLYVSMHLQDAVITVPKPGEIWMIRRKGNDWFLAARQDTGLETTRLSDLNAGDKRVEAAGTLYLNGESIIVNGIDLVQLISTVTPTGSIIEYGGTTAPTGFVMADGALYDGSDPLYADLFQAYGSLHNQPGDPIGFFRVPDKRGRVGVGKGAHTDVSTLGANDGLAANSRTPKHKHGKGDLAIGASGSHGHTFTGGNDTITGGAHGHSFTGAAHSHGPGTMSISGGSHGHSISDPGHAHGGVATADAGSGAATATPPGINPSGTSGSSGTGISIIGNTHSHPSGEWSGSSQSVTATGTISATDTHSHSYTPTGSLNSTTHSHTSADFTGNVGTTSGPAETSAFIVLNYIVKL